MDTSSIIYSSLNHCQTMAYRLKLHMESKVHQVFHILLSKKAVGEYMTKGSSLQTLQASDNTNMNGPKTVWLVTYERMTSCRLVQQKGKTAEETTWEASITIKILFPKYSIADKALVLGGSIIRTNPKETSRPGQWQEYFRKKKKRGVPRIQ